MQTYIDDDTLTNSTIIQNTEASSEFSKKEKRKELLGPQFVLLLSSAKIMEVSIIVLSLFLTIAKLCPFIPCFVVVMITSLERLLVATSSRRITASHHPPINHGYWRGTDG